MRHDERMVLFYDIILRAHAPGIPQPHLISTKDAFRHLLSMPIASMIKTYHNGNEHYFVQAKSETNGLVKILLNKSDNTLSDPTFIVPSARTRRTIRRNENEGHEFSCHMVIKPSDNPTEPALALIEQTNGISPMVIQRFFNHMLRLARRENAEEFTFLHPDGSFDADGNPRTYTVFYKFDLVGHPSAEFIDDIENGAIQGIELITERNRNQAWDEHGYIQESAKIVKLKPVELSGRVTRVANVLRSVFHDSRNNYEKARIKFKTSAGVGRTVLLDTGTMGVAQSNHYVKKERISDFDGRLQSSYESPCAQIVNKMIELLE